MDILGERDQEVASYNNEQSSIPNNATEISSLQTDTLCDKRWKR